MCGCWIGVTGRWRRSMISRYPITPCRSDVSRDCTARPGISEIATYVAPTTKRLSRWPQAADRGDALRTMTSGFGEIAGTQPTDRIQRQRHLLTQMREAIPADACFAGVARGWFDRADHGEIAANRFGGAEVVEGMAGRGEGHVVRHRTGGACVQGRQLRRTQMQPNAMFPGQFDIAVYHRLRPGLAA